MACALAVLGTGCASIVGDSSAPVAIEFATSQPPPIRLEEFDTVVVRVRVLDRAGDTIPGAPVRLVSLNPDTVAIDTVNWGLVGVRPGPARVLAMSGSLRSDPLAIQVVRAPDSLALAGPSRDTVRATDSASAPLVVQLLDLRTDTTRATGLDGDTVRFTIVYPAFASDSAATAVLGNGSLTAAVLTARGTPNGTASAIVKRKGAPPQPDSVVVQASAKRAVGTVVRGSPVQFVIRFQ